MGDSRAPWQSGQSTAGAATSTALRPRFFVGSVLSTPEPSQRSQRPCLVANENQRGSSSGAENPHLGQALCNDCSCSLPAALRSLTAPPPSLSARSKSARLKRLASTLGTTTRSMVCSLVL